MKNLLVFNALFWTFLMFVSSSVQAQTKGFKTWASETVFADKDGTERSLAEIMGAHSGKWLYVDFWASWCGPCLQEMPHSLRLRQKLPDSNRLVFLYLAIDDQAEPWLAAIERKGIDQAGEHYRISRTAAESFLRAMYIYSIPHYWIIDDKGMPKNLDAPPPSDTKLEKTLKKWAYKEDQ